jgi:hypothetical protein
MVGVERREGMGGDRKEGQVVRKALRSVSESQGCVFRGAYHDSMVTLLAIGNAGRRVE